MTPFHVPPVTSGAVPIAQAWFSEREMKQSLAPRRRLF